VTTGLGGEAVETASPTGDVPVATGHPAPTDRGLVVGLATGFASLGMLLWWVLQSPFVGLADNGDWGRYSCPLGLSGKVRFTTVPATLAREHCLAYDYRSTFTPFLWAFAKVDTFTSGSVHLSHLALFWSVVVSIGWGWFAFELYRVTGKAVRSSLATATLVVVSSDVIFTSYFGSIYAEALVIALAPSLAAALLRMVRCSPVDLPTLLGTSALVVVVTCAKPSMAFTAPLFVGVVVIAKRGSLDGMRVAMAAIAALGLALFSLTAIADPTLTSWNTYNLAFTVVLPESGDAQGTLVDMGIDPVDARGLRRFVGVEFGPSVTDAWDDPPLVAFRRAGRSKVVEAVALHPRIWAHMMQRGGSTMGDLRLEYLANHTGPADATTPRLAERPHPADAVLDGVAAVWWLLPLAWVVLAGWFASQLRRGSPDPRVQALRALGLFAVAFGALQTATALGDGYYELAKHLVIAGEVTALSVVGLLVAGLWALVERRRAPSQVSDPVGPALPR